MENRVEVLERCPICGRTTRQTIYRDFLEEPITVECICDCVSDDPMDHFKGPQREQYFHNIITDQKFKSAIFDNDDLHNPKITTFCKEYVINFGKIIKHKKNCLVFIGNTGTGKSFFAACIGNALMDAGYTVLATTLPRLSADIGFDDLNTKLKQLKQYQMLIIDDWGIERKTEIMDELLQTIVDERYRQGLPMILTSNRTTKQMIYPEDAMDHRIISRLAEMADVVPVTGTDRRMRGIQGEQT